MEKRVGTLPRFITIYQDEIPVGGDENFNVEKMNFTNLIVPHREDGGLDNRFTGLAAEILREAGTQTVDELQTFYLITNQAEKDYSRSALRLVIAFYAVEMEDWQRRVLKKQLRGCLQEMGFKPTTSTKLVMAGEFVHNQLKSTENVPVFGSESVEDARKDCKERTTEYLRSYGVAGLYLLSRMNEKGLLNARSYYQEHDSNPMCIKDLERLQQRFPLNEPNYRKLTASKHSIPSELLQLEPAVDSREPTTMELVNQFVLLTQSINWSSISENAEVMEALSSVEYTLGHITEELDLWKYSPSTQALTKVSRR